jgi:hypothetical protein
MIRFFLSGLQSVFSQIIQSSVNIGIAVGRLQQGKILRINMNNYLKILTGVGKTIMISYAVKIVAEALLEKEYPLNELLDIIE